MRKYWILGFFAAIFGCESLEEPKPVRVVPENIEPYVQRFIAEGAARGYEITIDELIIEFESPIGDENHPSANCTSAPGLPTSLIKLDTTLTWWWFGDMTREEVIFHELGHCVLGQSHRNELLSNGDPASIMRAKSPLLYLIIESINANLTYKRDYYLDELFAKDAPTPCWVHPDQPGQSDLLWIDDVNFGFRNLLIDAQGEVWGPDFEQLTRYNGKDQFEPVIGTADFNSGKGNAAALDGDGQLWIAKENNGLTTIWKHTGELRFEKVDPSFQLDRIRSMQFDEENNLWLAAVGGQVAFLDLKDTTLKVYNADNSSLPSGFISDMTIVSEADMYFIINNQLVQGAKGDQFEVIDQSNSNLPVGHIQHIGADPEGQLWVVINNQLVRQTGAGEFEVLDMIAMNLPFTKINTLAFDPSGELWLGTSFGLRHLKNGTRFTNYCKYFLGDENNDVRNIAFDNAGNIWTRSNVITRQKLNN